ncbi:MAG: Major outer membrane lipoprotein Lpp [Mycoplasmataceae bacterium]|nr:MAG: Major outer membrane lipoprotein Lpp [Mycoplasmataceae bacterium]
MLYSTISSNVADKSLVTSLQNEVNYLQTENNKYSSEIIDLNQQMTEYQESQRIALEEATISNLSIQDIRGLDIESLRNKLTEAN